MKSRSGNKLLIASALFLCGYLFAPPSGSGEVPSPIVRESLDHRESLVKRLKDSQKTVAEEIDRIISGSINERISYYNDFYDERIGALKKKEEGKDLILVQSIIDFLAEHPKDAKTPYALLKLAQVYLDEAESKYREAMESYAASKAKDKKQPVKDFSYAIKPLERIRSSFKDFEHMDASLYLLGYAYLYSGRAKDAQDTYTALATEHAGSPYAPEAYFRVGEYHFANKDFTRAQEAYQSVLRFKDAGSAGFGGFYDKALYKLAWSYYLSDRYDSAIREFTRLLDYEADSAVKDPIREDLKRDASMYVSFSLFKKGGISQALRFIEASPQKPYLYEIAKNLGDIYQDRGLFSNALSAYRTALTARPQHPQNPMVNKAIFLCLDKAYTRQDAIRERETVVSLYSQGSEWRLANSSDEPMNREADRLLEDAYYWLGITFDREARDSKSREKMEKAVENYSRLIREFAAGEKGYNAQFYLGEGYLWLGEPDSALVEYDATLKNNFYSRYYLESLYSEIVVYERKLDEQGGLDKFERSSYKTEKELEASIPFKILSICDQFMEKSPKDPRLAAVLYRSAEILEKLGEKERALERFASVVSDHTQTTYAKDALRKTLNIRVASSEWEEADRTGGEFLKNPYSEDANLKRDVVEIVALSRYKMAKRLEEKGMFDEAAAKLSSTAQDFPQTKVFEASLNNAFVDFQKSKDNIKAKGGLASLLKNYPENRLAPSIALEIADRERDGLKFESALAYYSRIRKEWPSSEEALASILRSAVVLETLEDYGKAADMYLDYADNSSDPALAKESFLKHILTLYEAGDAPRLLKAKGRQERHFKNDPAAASAILYLCISGIYASKGDRRFSDAFQEAEARFKKVSKPDPLLTELYYSQKLASLKPPIEEFLGIRLEFPKKRFISSFEKKATLLSKLEKQLSPIISSGSSKTASDSMLSLGRLYEDFGSGLSGVTLPSSMNEEERQITSDELKKMADPMTKKARSVYLKQLSYAKDRKFFIPSVKESLERLASLLGSESAVRALSLNFRNSSESSYYYHPGFDLTKVSSPDKTSSSFKKAISLLTNPNTSPEELKKGLALFDEAYDLDPQMKEARFNKAVLLRRLQRLDVAEFIYTSLKNDPSLGYAARLNLAEIYAVRKEYDRARAAWEELLSSDPASTDIISNIAQVERLKGNLDRSMELSLKVLEILPFDSRGYDNIAHLMLSAGKKKSAENILKKALEKAPANTTLLNSLAFIYIEEEDFEKAYEALLKAKGNNPFDRTANLNLLYTLLKTRNYEEGLTLARQLWSSQGVNEPDLYINVGLAYISNDMKKEAQEHYSANLMFAGPFKQEARSLISELSQDEKK